MRNRYEWERKLRGCIGKAPQQITPTEFVVLVMLSTYTTRVGSGARPAAATLAEDCGTSVKTVRRALATLTEKKYIEVTAAGGGKHRPTEYALVWDTPNQTLIRGHSDDHVTDDDEGPIPGHSDDHLTASERGHSDDHVTEPYVDKSRPHTWTNGDPYVDKAMTTDQVRSGTTSGNYSPPVLNSPDARDEPRGAEVVPLPTHLPNGRAIPKQTRHQMLAALNATARSAAATQLVTRIEATLDGRLDRQTAIEVAQIVDTLIADSIPEAQIVAGIEAWLNSDRVYPSQIPRFVAKAARTRPTRGAGDERVAGWQDLKHDQPRGIER